MATVKSKLKEALLEERNTASMQLRKNPSNIAIAYWFDSIERIIKICEDRKRY